MTDCPEGARAQAHFEGEGNKESAVDQIIWLRHEYPGELTLLVFGPLTNLGIAFVRDPHLAQWIERVVLWEARSQEGM